jgi:hypothetical protein
MITMITIKTTPNFYGISLQGDYLDLNELYDSISRYLELYMKSNEFYPYHEYEYLLSLNYDIRHAYMGTRNVEIKENNASDVGVFAESIFQIPEQSKKEFSAIRRKFKNGNLYFGVGILYPLVFHYLTSLNEIAYEEPSPEWFDNLPEHMPDYNMIRANKDRLMILHFTSLLWENIESLLGSDKALAAMEYYDNEDFFLAPYLYTDALLHWQLAHFGMLSEEDKKLFLIKALYEIIDSEDLSQYPDDYRVAYNHYKEATESLKKNPLPAFPEKDTFYKMLDEFLTNGEPLYESTFDTFLETHYGKIKNEDPEM